MDLEEVRELTKHTLDVLGELREDIRVLRVYISDGETRILLSKLEDIYRLADRFNVTPEVTDATRKDDTRAWVYIAFSVDDRLAFECYEHTADWREYMEEWT